MRSVFLFAAVMMVVLACGDSPAPAPTPTLIPTPNVWFELEGYEEGMQARPYLQKIVDAHDDLKGVSFTAVVNLDALGAGEGIAAVEGWINFDGWAIMKDREDDLWMVVDHANPVEVIARGDTLYVREAGDEQWRNAPGQYADLHPALYQVRESFDAILSTPLFLPMIEAGGGDDLFQYRADGQGHVLSMGELTYSEEGRDISVSEVAYAYDEDYLIREMVIRDDNGLEILKLSVFDHNKPYAGPEIPGVSRPPPPTPSLYEIPGVSIESFRYSGEVDLALFGAEGTVPFTGQLIGTDVFSTTERWVQMIYGDRSIEMLISAEGPHYVRKTGQEWHNIRSVGGSNSPLYWALHIAASIGYEGFGGYWDRGFVYPSHFGEEDYEIAATEDKYVLTRSYNHERLGALRITTVVALDGIVREYEIRDSADRELVKASFNGFNQQYEAYGTPEHVEPIPADFWE